MARVIARIVRGGRAVQHARWGLTAQVASSMLRQPSAGVVPCGVRVEPVGREHDAMTRDKRA